MFVQYASLPSRTSAGCNVLISSESQIARDQHCTPLGCSFFARPVLYRHSTTTRPLPYHNVLLCVVERDSLASLQSRDCHAQRHRVVVSRVNVRIRRLARANAFHPVAHVRDRGIVGTRVCVGFGLHRLLRKRHRREQGGFFAHSLSFLLTQSAFRSALLGGESQ